MPKINVNFFTDDSDTVSYAEGDTIFVAGDVSNTMYGIHKGTVAITYHDEVIRTLGPGDIFGEMGIIDGSPRSATVVAQTDCQLAVIDEANFFYRIQHHPTFALFVLQTVVERLREETLRR